MKIISISAYLVFHDIVSCWNFSRNMHSLWFTTLVSKGNNISTSLLLSKALTSHVREPSWRFCLFLRILFGPVYSDIDTWYLTNKPDIRHWTFKFYYLLSSLSDLRNFSDILTSSKSSCFLSLYSSICQYLESLPTGIHMTS